MARTTRLFGCPPEAVFAVLAAGWTYPSWVVGASRMRGVDEGWPEPGSSIRHSVGVWPALLDDETTVVEGNAPHRAAFTARGWPIGEARIIVEVRSHARGCVVRMQEYALRGPGALVPRFLMDPPVHYRNVEALRRLAYLAEGQWQNHETDDGTTREERGGPSA